ncbi:MAG TPA: DUF6484 domain-containing protein [Variovorax sp.]|nr:DUF6484 domain-containing protein [Variovorax sp.]
MHTLESADALETLDIDAEVAHVDLLAPLLRAPPSASPRETKAAEVGELMALDASSGTAWVRIAGTPNADVVAARSVVDLHAAHVGREVLLDFIGGDASRPVIVGVFAGAGASGWPDARTPNTVQIDADGARLIVGAKDQLVLRCGKASITLTKAGKVLIEGSYVLSRSTGVNRVKGGSVQLN